MMFKAVENSCKQDAPGEGELVRKRIATGNCTLPQQGDSRSNIARQIISLGKNVECDGRVPCSFTRGALLHTWTCVTTRLFLTVIYRPIHNRLHPFYGLQGRSQSLTANVTIFMTAAVSIINTSNAGTKLGQGARVLEQTRSEIGLETEKQQSIRQQEEGCIFIGMLRKRRTISQLWEN